MATKKSKEITEVKIKLLRDNAKVPKLNGNWYDCYSSGIQVFPGNETPNWNADRELYTNRIVTVQPGQILVVHLGFALDMGEGFEAHILPRSSTFTKYGLLLSNSMGLIDSEYNGDNDEWKAVFYATRFVRLPIDTRLVQMTIQKSNPPIDFRVEDTLGNEDRGGYGSTGE